MLSLSGKDEILKSPVGVTLGTISGSLMQLEEFSKFSLKLISTTSMVKKIPTIEIFGAA